ncbi:MAG TPA: sigma-70 family RNA polymerase sigma factor [Polyangia bacterium]|jgi:RNA polymerase sigma-32 factor|nr:sigma-70 family RNA polymerase sigma factor [Polyangia bacterium]
MPSKPRQQPNSPDQVADSDEAEVDASAPLEPDEVIPEGSLDEAPVPPPDEPSSQRGLSRLRDPVDRFLAEARRYPRLSEEEERVLGSAVRERGDMNAAKKLVVHNLRLVVAIAFQYRRAWANILDLFQEGSVGLMEAVKRWEPTLGPRFGSYAAYWIRAYVLKFLMTNSRLIHVGNTRAGRKMFFRLEKERQKLLAAGFEPTPKLLAAKLDVDEKDFNEVRQHLDSREVSLEPGGRSGGEDEGYALSERLATDAHSPEDEAAQAEMSDALKRFVDGFRQRLADEREIAVWAEHLAAEDPVPLGTLGQRYGVSKQRMGQIADRLKKRFRTEVVEQLGGDIKTDWLGGETES